MMGEPIDCREAAERLQDFLKQELTPELEAEMRAHLERCRPCFHEARFEANFVLMLEVRARRVECPAALRARIARLLQSEMERG
jgi:anti-sigma factor (TIGR02949 family)